MEGLIAPVWLITFGACVGSFTNVVVWRLPREESVVYPGSHCPRCGHAVRWHDNMPLLGWLLLAGRCRDCSASISWRYPVVESLSALLWLSTMLVSSGGGGGVEPSLQPWIGLPLVGLLLPLVLIDLDHMWLPESLCRWGVLLGLMASVTGGAPVFADHMIGAALSLMALETLSALAEKALGQPALGLGDAKLAALGGAWLGVFGIAIAMAISVFSGAIVGSIGRLTGRLKPRQPFPFGPFIALGIWLVWLKGPNWWWDQWLNIF